MVVSFRPALPDSSAAQAVRVNSSRQVMVRDRWDIGVLSCTLTSPGSLEVLRFYPTKTSTLFRKGKTLVLPATKQLKEEGATKKPPPDLNGSSVVNLLCPSRQ
jgi:hypothetical protein